MKKYFFRVICFAMVSVVLVGMTFGTAIHAQALSEEEFEQLVSETKDLLSQKKDYSIDDLMSFSDTVEMTPLDTSSFYNALEDLNMGTFSCLKYDIENATVDNVNALNLQYLSMVSDLQNAGYGTTSDIKIPQLETGYSTNITEAFQNTFGDLSGKYTDNTEAFMNAATTKITLDTSIKAAQSQRDAGDIKSTDLYKTVVENISAANVVANAQTTLETPELKTALELSSLLSESASVMGAEWEERQQAALLEIQSAATKNDTSLNEQTAESLQELFEESSNTTDSWVSQFAGGNTTTNETVSVISKFANLFGQNGQALAIAFLGGGITGSTTDPYINGYDETPNSPTVGELIEWVDENWEDSPVNPENNMPPAQTEEEQEAKDAYDEIVLGKTDSNKLMDGYEAALRKQHGDAVPHWEDFPNIEAYEAELRRLFGSNYLSFGEYMISQGGFK